MSDSPTFDPIQSRLQYTYTLFEPIRARFRRGSVRRGGHDRPDATPIYARRFGVDPATLFKEVKGYGVESSYTVEQEQIVMESLTLLRTFVAGDEERPPFAEHVVQAYLTRTAPSFTLALLRATEALLSEVVGVHPEEAATFDAIFRVAGGEGFRDLIRIYGPRLLEAALDRQEMAQPDILTFVDVHDGVRREPSGTSIPFKYEVWCPGRTLARTYLNQAQHAATTLVREHGVTLAPTLRQELLNFPQEVSGYLNEFVQNLLTPILKRYRIT